MLKRFSMLLGASTLMLLSTSGAFATVLAPGACVNAGAAGGGCSATYTDFAAIAYGVPSADTGVQAFTGKDGSGNTTFTGSLRQIVVLDGGFLDFIYQFVWATGDPIAHLSTTDFSSPFTTNVGVCSACADLVAGVGDIPATSISRSGGSGNVVDFAFLGGVGGVVAAPNTRSAVLVIKTKDRKSVV